MATAAGTTTQQQLEAEVKTLGKFPHVRLVPLLGCCLEAGHPPCIVYALMAGGSLAQRLGKRADFSFRNRLTVCSEVAEGLAFLHCEAKIIHRDIKTGIVVGD